MKLLNKANSNKIIFYGNLTQRESGCLLLAAQGKSIKETAEIMNVKPSTVKTWRKKIIRKLGCTTITQAVYEGIISGERG